MATARLASLRTPSTPRRRIRPLGLAIATATAAIAAVAGPVTAGHAAPQLTISQAQARVAALNERAEKITEAYNGARDRLTTLKRQQNVAARQLRHDERRLAAVRSIISATAERMSCLSRAEGTR